jgi:DNA-binding transcriptional MerR regulator
LLYFATVASPVIPNRPLFRAQEVCELADVQAYVLRSWEAEFPDLGIAKSPGSARVYRRADVERVLRIKQLVFVDGLTLAGARRRLSEDDPSSSASAASGPVGDAEFADLLNETTRQELLNVRRGLSWILGVLNGQGTNGEEFALNAPSAPANGASPSASRKAKKPTKAAGASRKASGRKR